MEWLETLVNVVHVLAAVALVGLVLLQHGKGADAGAAFGSGASQTVFGSQGSGSFLTKLTAWIAVVFFVTSFSLAVYAKHRAEKLAADSDIIPALIESPLSAPEPVSENPSAKTPGENASKDMGSSEVPELE